MINLLAENEVTRGAGASYLPQRNTFGRTTLFVCRAHITCPALAHTIAHQRTAVAIPASGCRARCVLSPNVALAIVSVVLMGAGQGKLSPSCFPLTDPIHRAQHLTLNSGVGCTSVVGC